MYACLAVTCHLHFWQNDRDFLRATVVTRGWNGYRNKSQHRKKPLRSYSALIRIVGQSPHPPPSTPSPGNFESPVSFIGPYHGGKERAPHARGSGQTSSSPWESVITQSEKVRGSLRMSICRSVIAQFEKVHGSLRSPWELVIVQSEKVHGSLTRSLGVSDCPV